MKTRLNLGRWVAVAALATAVAASLASGAGAKPHASSAPKVGTYGGDSIAGGQSHAVSANVKKRGSKYSAEVELAFPAKCTNTETGFTGPTELLYKVTAQVKGRSLSFRGQAVDTMQILFGAPSEITLNGSFTSATKLTATASAQAPAPGVQSGTSCSVTPAKRKFELELPA
jgi:hypothetical protein